MFYNAPLGFSMMFDPAYDDTPKEEGSSARPFVASSLFGSSSWN